MEGLEGKPKLKKGASESGPTQIGKDFGTSRAFVDPHLAQPLTR
jgi:hypothetical protein